MHTATRLFSATVFACLLSIFACLGDPSPGFGAPAANDAPSAAALEAGRAAHLHHRAAIRKPQLWTLIDYTLPFTDVRLWVLDARHDDAVLASSRVSHAWNSGMLFASRFSNQPGSELSSLGSFVTAARPYDGGYGRSLRVRGLDPGQNDNALERAIIFHPDMGLTHSAGCFMLPDRVAKRIVDTIAGGSFVYVHAILPASAGT